MIAPALAALLLAAAPAQRTPVLPQIALPHSYYYRELYLPQLTSGPSSACWLPGGDALVVSMAGSLWRVRLDGSGAEHDACAPVAIEEPRRPAAHPDAALA